MNSGQQRGLRAERRASQSWGSEADPRPAPGRGRGPEAAARRGTTGTQSPLALSPLPPPPLAWQGRAECWLERMVAGL